MINSSLLNNYSSSSVATKLEVLYQIANEEYQNISAANAVLSWWVSNDGVSIYEKGMANDLLTAFNLTIEDIQDAGRVFRYAYIYDYINNRLYQIRAFFLYGEIPGSDTGEIVIPGLEIGYAGNTDGSQYVKLYQSQPTGADPYIHVMEGREDSIKGWWSFDDLVNSGGSQATTYLYISEMAKLLIQGCTFEQFASVANAFSQSIPSLSNMVRQSLVAFAESGAHGVVDYLSKYFTTIRQISTDESGIIVPDEDTYSVRILNPFSTVSDVIMVAADIVTLAVSFINPLTGIAINLITTAIRAGSEYINEQTTPSVNTASMFNTMGAPVRLSGDVIPTDIYDEISPILTSYGIADLISPYGMIRVYAPNHPNIDRLSLVVDIMISVNRAQSDITWYNTTTDALNDSRGVIHAWPVRLGAKNAEVSDITSPTTLENIYESSAISLIHVCLTGTSAPNSGNDIFVPPASPLFQTDLSRFQYIGRTWAQTQELLDEFITTYGNVSDLVRIGSKTIATNPSVFVMIYRYFIISSSNRGWVPGTIAYQPYILSPNVDRSSLITTIVLGTALVAAAVVVTFSATRRIVNALTKAQIKAQGRLLNAATNAYYNPSVDNLKSYRSAKRTAKWLNVLSGFEVSSNTIAYDNTDMNLNRIEELIQSVKTLITG